MDGLDWSGNVADPVAWLAANPEQHQWLRRIVAWLDRYGDHYATDEERAAGYRDYVENLSIMQEIYVKRGKV